MTVTALLVSHDGARWLPAVLDGLARQTRRPDRTVAVDTGSADASRALLRERLGDYSVIPAPVSSSYGAAVGAALRKLPAATSPEDPDWIWLLHDDSAPAPDALEMLLAAAQDNPSVSVLGPKLREWPSLRRLLEVGVTISGTGRRETGLERGEYDQGQHDQGHDVLAVNTAGMLVRREVLEELGGFDDRLPVFGSDVDFGWRAARAGHRTIVVPEAVLFHAEAASRGVRRTGITTRHYHRAARRAALYTLLVNGSAAALPFQAVRLVFGTLIRAFGFLLVRAPGEAYEEVTALVLTYLRPDRILSGRVARRRTARVRPREVRHLLAPPWLPYRHGLDFVTDIAVAVALQASDLRAQRSRRVEDAETGPVPSEMQSLPEDTGLLARLVTSPTAGAFAVLVVVALACTRGLLGSGMLSGGGLLPAPTSALGWWHTYFESWHQVGTGSSTAAAPYLLPLAVAGSLLFGKAWLAVDLLFFFAVPLAAFGAYRFLSKLDVGRLPTIWGAVAYGLLPVLSGAVSQGRLGTVAAAVVLPWLAHSALFLTPSFSADRRWRAAWRTALWLALLAAFAPLAWPFAVLLAVVAVFWGCVADRAVWARPSAWGPVLVPVAMVPILLLPWSLQSLLDGGAAAWLLEAGLPVPGAGQALTPWDVLLGRPGGPGAAPLWVSAGVVLAAVAALVRRDTRSRVLRPWVVLVLSAVVTALLAGRTVVLASTTQHEPLWLGFPLLLVQASAIWAAATAGTGVHLQISGRSFGWRQPLGLLVAAIAVVAPVAGLVWWAGTGVTGPLDRRPASAVPAYMTSAAMADPDHGALVVRGSQHAGFEYLVLRDDGQRLGDDSLLPPAGEQKAMTTLVGNLATAATPADVAALGDEGVQYVYAPPPADSRLVGNLDSVSGLSPFSAFRPGSAAWQLDSDPTGKALRQQPDSLRPWLLGAQAVAILAAVVLAAPSRKARR